MAKRLGVVEQREQFLIGCRVIQKARVTFCKDSFSVFGIDPARGATGWAYKNFPKEIIKTGVIVPPTSGFSKVIYVEKKLRKLLKPKFSFIALEGYAHNAKYGREKAGELGGVIRRLLFKRELPLIVISPTVLKAWVRAKSKSQIMLEILDRYQIKISQEDAADAFVLSDIMEKGVYMAEHVSRIKLRSPEDVRLYFKEGGYKEEKILKNLFKYQADSLFRLISSHGKEVIFFQNEIL